MANRPEHEMSKAGGFCCRVHPRCKGGSMQAAVVRPSTATITLGMLLAGGDARVACPGHVSLACGTGRPWRATFRCPGVRGADARSPSPVRSTGIAASGVRSMVAAQWAACPACRAPSRWACAPCATASAAGGARNQDGASQSCVSAAIEVNQRVRRRLR